MLVPGARLEPQRTVRPMRAVRRDNALRDPSPVSECIERTMRTQDTDKEADKSARGVWR